eukprot:5218347-Amphidinium_carterae.1
MSLGQKEQTYSVNSGNHACNSRDIVKAPNQFDPTRHLIIRRIRMTRQVLLLLRICVKGYKAHDLCSALHIDGPASCFSQKGCSTQACSCSVMDSAANVP